MRKTPLIARVVPIAIEIGLGLGYSRAAPADSPHSCTRTRA
jgi:hypothetical protein